MELNTDFNYSSFSLLPGLNKAVLDLIYLKYCCKSNFLDCTFMTSTTVFHKNDALSKNCSYGK